MRKSQAGDRAEAKYGLKDLACPTLPTTNDRRSPRHQLNTAPNQRV